MEKSKSEEKIAALTNVNNNLCIVQEIQNNNTGSCESCSKTCAERYIDSKERVTFNDIQLG